MNARVAFNTTDAAAIALEAGMDQTMGGGLSPDITLPAVASGEISAAIHAEECCSQRTCVKDMLSTLTKRIYEYSPDMLYPLLRTLARYQRIHELFALLSAMHSASIFTTNNDDTNTIVIEISNDREESNAKGKIK